MKYDQYFLSGDLTVRIVQHVDLTVVELGACPGFGSCFRLQRSGDGSVDLEGVLGEVHKPELRLWAQRLGSLFAQQLGTTLLFINVNSNTTNDLSILKKAEADVAQQVIPRLEPLKNH